MVDEQFEFYFFTHVDTKKYRNLKEHPQVGLTITDDYTQTTVQASGEVTEVPLGEEFDTAYRKLVLVHPPGQFSWVPPVRKMHDRGETAILKLVPQVLQFSSFKPEKYNPGGYVTRII
jgi:nitroimidazol reductase NimA-like FMN-containing flavoprotein (pyridoxamine 5'-phosphate oxidase superfamily)